MGELENIRKSIEPGTTPTGSCGFPILLDAHNVARLLPNGTDLNPDAAPFHSISLMAKQQLETNRMALRQQIEFYFSRENFLTDKYLLSQVLEDGWDISRLL